MKKYLSLFCLVSSPVIAADLDQVEWGYEERPYFCSLSAELPYKSIQAELIAMPEQPITLRVNTQGAYRFGGGARVLVEPVEWSYGQSEVLHDFALDYQARNRLESTDSVKDALHMMSLGSQLVVVGPDRKDAFVPVGFSEKSKSFEQCYTKLPQISFTTGRDAEVYFASGAEAVTSPRDIELLENIAHLIEYDGGVVKVLIDGFTDSSGDHIENLELSRKRAEHIAVFLADRGVAIDSIEIRSHGSRKLRYNEKTRNGRAKNRRVQIRLIKG